ncbi:MAG: histidine phosphatase family protein [Pseudomonadota bacterium]
MSLTLILMRHAKSAWDDPTQEDFDRPLNGRGRTSAHALGLWLLDRGYLPDEVIVSGARRTVETWSRMADRFPATTAMQSNPALYLASAETILGVLKTAQVPTIMLIAHNPGIGQFARKIITSAPPHPKFGQYPTGATTVVTFDIDSWDDLDWGAGAVAEFVVPRELAQGSKGP